AMSRGYCCNTCCIDSRSLLETEIAQILDMPNNRPFWNGDWFYSLLNLVWLLGYYPETDYYTLNYTEPRTITEKMIWEKLKRMYPGQTFTDEQVERIVIELTNRSEDGVFEDIRSNRYGTVLWDTRVRRNPRQVEQETEKRGDRH
ncbi:MAG: hypothetical protein ACI4D7_05215, partial [Lachnospiraceae bacterium]